MVNANDKRERKLSHIAELRRKLEIGTKVTLIGFRGTVDGVWCDLKHSDMHVTRYVVAKHSRGVELNLNKAAVEGSFMEYPKKHELKRLDDKGFRFCYDDGVDLEYEYVH